jgi:hypothetical protein
MADLMVIVPSRGRPESIPRVVEAWNATGGFDDADLAFVVDTDDPCLDRYGVAASDAIPPLARVSVADVWRPLVPKLNLATAKWAGDYLAVGFAGDDHLPRTHGWAKSMLAALREMGTGIVYGDDLLQGERLCTSWVMTSDIVTTLGRMVPAPVDHMFCDNAVMDLGRLAGCLRYLPDVVIEHMHPVAGKADWDPGYEHVNRPEQYRVDELAYGRWIREGRAADVVAVRALMSATV